MRTQFHHDYKADLIFHLKQGPVSLTKKTIESLYLDSVPYGVSFRLGPLGVQRYPLGVKNSNDLLLARTQKQVLSMTPQEEYYLATRLMMKWRRTKRRRQRRRNRKTKIVR